MQGDIKGAAKLTSHVVLQCAGARAAGAGDAGEHVGGERQLPRPHARDVRVGPTAAAKRDPALDPAARRAAAPGAPHA